MATNNPHYGRTAVRVLATDGLHFLANLSAADASAVGRHWNVIRHYLDTGHTYDLADFDRVEVAGTDEQGSSRTVALETDPDQIDMHAIRGDVRFESIYDEVQ